MWSIAVAASLWLSPLAPDDALPDPGAQGELELAALIEPARLSLVNPTASPALVRVLDEQGFELAGFAVPGRSERVLDFSRRSLHGTSLGVVVVSPGGRLVSGRYSVDRILESGFRAVWFESAGRAVHAWGELPTGPAFVDPIATGMRTAASKPAVPSVHVPVVVPANKPKGDLPPRIELKPLPPV
jgi:hypothetical protein